jgi:hypothetical protein
MSRLLVVAALALVAGTAHAQSEPRRFSVGVQAGGYNFDKAAGLENAGFAGIDATYQFPTSRLAPRLEPGLGFYVSAALPTTDYTQFPIVAFDFGDTTFLRGVSQRVRVFEYGAQASLGTTLGRFRLYGLGAAGFYTIVPDARVASLKTFTEPEFQIGGGVNWVVNRALGIRAELRNATWTSFDRDRLDPSVGYSREQRLGDVLPPPVAAKSTIQNLRFGLVFSYVPGGTSTGDEPVREGQN